jgi:type I restriction enzyme S subunit
LTIAVPLTIEQRRILEYLDGKMGMIRKLHEKLSKLLSILEQYRKSLIHEYVTGKRRITEEDMRVVQQY